MGLDAVEIVMDVEDHFGITIQNSEAERIRTADDILCELRTLIVNVTGVDADEIVPDARFREDLGVG